MKHIAKLGTGLALAAATCAPGHAQSLRAFEHDGRADLRASVGITIPFGGQRQASESKPRFDLRMESGRIGPTHQIDTVINPRFLDRRNVQRATFSLTFEDNPRFLLNGTSLDHSRTLRSSQDDADAEAEQAEDEGKERTTGQKILRGAAITGAVVAVVSAATLAAFIANCDGGCGE